MQNTQIDNLLSIMSALRDPITGCAWDVKQTFATIAPYTIEEAYEVVDAIERNNMPDLKEELGDLLLQVVFHSQMAQEQGAFTFEDVAGAISKKMVRRHPHVFGERKNYTPEQIKALWQEIKLQEKPAKSDFFANITNGLPPILKAIKIQKEVAKVGFDWDNPKDVYAKIEEELSELHAEIEAKDKAKQEDELGDVLFAVINLARHLDLDPEKALAKTNAKFMKRFLNMENHLNEKGQTLVDASLDEMEHSWIECKKSDRQSD